MGGSTPAGPLKEGRADPVLAEAPRATPLRRQPPRTRARRANRRSTITAAIPAAVIAALKGEDEPYALTYLTREWAEEASRDSKADRYVMDTPGVFSRAGKKVSKMDDFKLTYQQWDFATRRELAFWMANPQYMSPDDIDLWLVAHEDFRKIWTIYHDKPQVAAEYVAEIRWQTLEGIVDPSFRHNGLLTEIVLRDATRTNATQHRLSPSTPKRSADGFGEQRRPPPPLPRSGSGFRGDREPSEEKCFRCGRKSHRVPDCTATTTVAGKACAERGGKPSTLLLPGGGEYCFTFSYHGACTRACKPLAHTCSICGGGHGARSCSFSA